MKTINLKTNAELIELIYRPNLPLTVQYIVKDTAENVVLRKTALIKLTDLPLAGQTALATLAQRLLANVEVQEGLT